MVRLRLINLEPDFGNPTTPAISRPLPLWSHITAILESLTFELHYLVEGLLSHGSITVPEVGDLVTSLRRFRPDDQVLILEGLFKWTRRGSIDVDIRRELVRCTAD